MSIGGFAISGSAEAVIAPTTTTPTEDSSTNLGIILGIVIPLGILSNLLIYSQQSSVSLWSSFKYTKENQTILITKAIHISIIIQTRTYMKQKIIIPKKFDYPFILDYLQFNHFI